MPKDIASGCVIFFQQPPPAEDPPAPQDPVPADGQPDPGGGTGQPESRSLYVFYLLLLAAAAAVAGWIVLYRRKV
jgi:hypothetical protein